LQPFLPSCCGLVTLQPALGFVWNCSPKPALADKRVEIILAERLAVYDADKRLDFASFTRLLTEPENLHCDLAGDLAGRLVPPFFGLLDKRGMEAQANEKVSSVFVSFKNRRSAADGKPDLFYEALYMANCPLSSDWQFKQSVAVALPAVILKAGGLRGWAARFLPGRVAG
jgi:hypothetical protein